MESPFAAVGRATSVSSACSFLGIAPPKAAEPPPTFVCLPQLALFLEVTPLYFYLPVFSSCCLRIFHVTLRHGKDTKSSDSSPPVTSHDWA
jgi:hypothetical protein